MHVEKYLHLYFFDVSLQGIVGTNPVGIFLKADIAPDFSFGAISIACDGQVYICGSEYRICFREMIDR